MKDLIEEVDCPLCGARSYEVLRPSHYPGSLDMTELLAVYSSSSDHVLLDALVECRNCHLVYLNPRISRDVIQSSYASAVDPQFISQNQERIRTFRRNLDHITRKYALKPTLNTHVLDVGCAGSAFPKAAADAGFSVIGIEPSKWLAEQGRLAYGLDIRAGRLEEQNLEDETFDLVTLWDVIEHLTDPSEVLGRIHRLLRPGGLLLINYPDYGSLARRVLGYKWPFFLSVHLTYFTSGTMTRFLGMHGFDVLEVRPFWQTLQLAYVLKRAGAYFGIFSWLGRGVSAAGLGCLPVTYTIGQSFLMARKSS